MSVARVIELFNQLKKQTDQVSYNDLHLLLQYLYPFASMFAEDMWAQLNASQGILNLPPLSKQSAISSHSTQSQLDGYTVMLNSKRVDGVNLSLVDLETIADFNASLDTFKLEADKHRHGIEALVSLVSRKTTVQPANKVNQVIVNNRKRLLNILYAQK